MSERIRVIVEGTEKKTFATAADWPGWSRSGKTETDALAALAAHATRYAPIAAEAGIPFDPRSERVFEVVERVEGSAGTTFGVPSQVAAADREPIDEGEAGRRAGLVRAAWRIFDRIAEAAPAELRKGPRGGGRDTRKIVSHTIEADQAYAREIGLKVRVSDPADRDAVEAMRDEMLAVLRQPSDGAPLAGRRWTVRYAAARIAWHALDHAWEIEDRSEPRP